jgi:hypothetical protein
MSQRNAADPDELERADLVVRRQDEDLRWVLSDPRGRRFLWELLGRCGLYRLSYEHSGSATMFKEGERNVGLTLLGRITEVDHAAYLLAQEEAQDLVRRDTERLKLNDQR